jgi:hypothetical protein
MVAFLEVAGTIALFCFILYTVVLSYLAWVQTKSVYRLIQRRFYRRSLQHSLASRQILAKMTMWAGIVVALLIVKSGGLIQILAFLALIATILRSSIPPVVLVSSASKVSTATCVLREVTSVTWPMRTIHFLRDDTMSVDRMRTVDDYYWEEAYGSFADFVPVVVIDCANVTTHLLGEARYMLNPIRRWKVIFVCNDLGNCPLLEYSKLVEVTDSTLTVVHLKDLRNTLINRLSFWSEIHNNYERVSK